MFVYLNLCNSKYALLQKSTIYILAIYILCIQSMLFAEIYSFVYNFTVM